MPRRGAAARPVRRGGAARPRHRSGPGDYEKLLPDGRRLSSVSAVLREDDGTPSLVLCVNLDRTPLERAAAVLSAFGAPTTAPPEPLFDADWAQRVDHVIGSQVRAGGRAVERMTRQDRLAVVHALDEAGAFSVRRAAPVVAEALRVSRSTVYGLLTEARAKG